MPKLPLRFDPAACVQCGDCVSACPSGALELSGSFIAIDPDCCDACEECALACPTTAISLVGRCERPARAVPTRSAGPPRWRLLDLGGALAALALLQAGVGLLPGVKELGPPGRWVVLAATLLFYGLIVGTVWGLARLKGRRLADLGFGGFKVGRSLVAVFSVMTAVWATRILYARLVQLFGLDPPSVREQVLGLFGTGPIGFALALLVTVTVAPIVEELFFRGLVYQALKERTGAAWAGALSALIFAIYHFSLWLIVPILLLGLALAWLTEWQRSLWPAIIGHALNNLVAVLIVYFLSR